MSSIQILYFGSLAETLDITQETYNKPDNIRTVDDLKRALSHRGPLWQKILNQNTTQCAVDQQLASPETKLESAREIAFFPPVTGG